MYFNYHAMAQNLIRNKDLIAFKITSRYNAVSPALVLYFKSHIPMPIRSHKWQEYLDLIDKIYD